MSNLQGQKKVRFRFNQELVLRSTKLRLPKIIGPRLVSIKKTVNIFVRTRSNIFKNLIS